MLEVVAIVVFIRDYKSYAIFLLYIEFALRMRTYLFQMRERKSMN